MVESYLNTLISICDESYEKAEHHVDEERDERIKVDPAEKPHHSVLLLELGKRREHVVPVHQGEEAFGHAAQTLKLAPMARIHADIKDTALLITCLKDYVVEKTRVIFIHLLLKLDNNKLSPTKYKCCHLMVKRLRHTVHTTAPFPRPYTLKDGPHNQNIQRSRGFYTVCSTFKQYTMHYFTFSW